MNPCRQLVAFAQNQLDADDVFRALVSYEQWLAPVPVLREHYGRTAFDQVVMYGHVADFPPGELWLFTDDDAAHRAKIAGSNLGAFAINNAGVDLFENLHPDWQFIRVNPVSTAELSWTFPRGTFAVLQAWVAAIRFEAEVRTWASGRPVDLNALAGYRQFSAFLFANNSVLTLPEQGGLMNPAVVLTAADCARDLLTRLPDAVRNDVRQVFTTGEQLIDILPEQGVDGLLINPFGPGPMFPLRLTAR